jgi:hypothetical protein
MNRAPPRRRPRNWKCIEDEEENEDEDESLRKPRQLPLIVG